MSAADLPCLWCVHAACRYFRRNPETPQYGMGMLNAAAAEADYAHSIKPSKAGGGAAGAASAAAGMSPQMLGGSATRHHHLLRRATTANLGKGGFCCFEVNAELPT
eukprot:1157421-Pelagomonas_calceolata.AAC.2